MANTFTKVDGVYVPAERPASVRCGHCPAMIVKSNESDGRLHFIGKYPACVRCRVLGGKMGATIKSDRPAFDDDLKAKDEIVQRKANEEIARIAQESQEATKLALADN